VVLRSVCDGILVAFAQMVVLGVGQMNLSVGALGGMTAISFSGMMKSLWKSLGCRCGWPFQSRSRSAF
jgi:ribose transport system permease protein